MEKKMETTILHDRGLFPGGAMIDTFFDLHMHTIYGALRLGGLSKYAYIS